MGEIRSCSSTQPLSKWVKGPPVGGTCRTCSLTSLAVMYEQTLRAEGQVPAADEFLHFLEGPKITPTSVAKKMDELKARFPDTVGIKLRSLDCDMQSE